MNESEWEVHDKANNPIWEHFLKSKTKDKTKSNRYRAKCVYCSIEIDGKPDLLRKHVISSCTKINFELRSAITQSSIKKDVSSIRSSVASGSKVTTMDSDVEVIDQEQFTLEDILSL